MGGHGFNDPGWAGVLFIPICALVILSPVLVMYLFSLIMCFIVAFFRLFATFFYKEFRIGAIICFLLLTIAITTFYFSWSWLWSPSGDGLRMFKLLIFLYLCFIVWVIPVSGNLIWDNINKK